MHPLEHFDRVTDKKKDKVYTDIEKQTIQMLESGISVIKEEIFNAESYVQNKTKQLVAYEKALELVKKLIENK